MNWLIEILQLLNGCSPYRAGAYMFFIVILTYIVLSIIGTTLTDIMFAIKGYKESNNDDTDDTDKDV